jgi:hypothetical protein
MQQYRIRWVESPDFVHFPGFSSGIVPPAKYPAWNTNTEKTKSCQVAGQKLLFNPASL